MCKIFYGLQNYSHAKEFFSRPRYRPAWICTKATIYIYAGPALPIIRPFYPLLNKQFKLKSSALGTCLSLNLFWRSQQKCLSCFCEQDYGKRIILSALRVSSVVWKTACVLEYGLWSLRRRWLYRRGVHSLNCSACPAVCQGPELGNGTDLLRGGESSITTPTLQREWAAGGRGHDGGFSQQTPGKDALGSWHVAKGQLGAQLHSGGSFHVGDMGSGSKRFIFIISVGLSPESQMMLLLTSKCVLTGFSKQTCTAKELCFP